MHRGDSDHPESYYSRDHHDSRRFYDSYPDERRGDPHMSDRRREVCKNYLLGRCKKGHSCVNNFIIFSLIQESFVVSDPSSFSFCFVVLISCPYSHSSYIPEGEKREMCRDYQRGSCPRGERACPFIHALAPSAAMPPRDHGLVSPPRRYYSSPPSMPISSRGGSANPFPLPLPHHAPPSATLKVINRTKNIIGPARLLSLLEWTRGARGLPRLLVQEEVRITFWTLVDNDSLMILNHCTSCARGKNCPYLHVALDDKDSEATNKRRRVTQEQEELERANQLLREENATFKKDNEVLRRENEVFKEENSRLQEYLEEVSGRAMEEVFV